MIPRRAIHHREGVVAALDGDWFRHVRDIHRNPFPALIIRERVIFFRSAVGSRTLFRRDGGWRRGFERGV